MKIEKANKTKKTKDRADRAAWIKKNRGVPESREQARARLICRKLR